MCAAIYKTLGLRLVDCDFDVVNEVDVVGSTLLVAGIVMFAVDRVDQCLIGSETQRVSKKIDRCNGDHHTTRWQRLL